MLEGGCEEEMGDKPHKMFSFFLSIYPNENCTDRVFMPTSCAVFLNELVDVVVGPYLRGVIFRLRGHTSEPAAVYSFTDRREELEMGVVWR